MERARVTLFEDRQEARMLFNLALGLEGKNHELVAEGHSLEAALQIIDNIEFDVAIVDGNLSRHDCSGQDGREIVSRLRMTKPAAKIIWFSQISAEDCGVIGLVDTDSRKDAFLAVEAINNL